MEITAKIKQLLPIHIGAGITGQWSKREIIVTPMAEHSKDTCVLVWGDKCNDTILATGLTVQIKFYLKSTLFNNKWSSQAIATDILPATDKSEEVSISIQVEEIFLNNIKLPNRLAGFKSIQRNNFYIVGRTVDYYSNKICIGMQGSLDPSFLSKGMTLKIPLQIEPASDNRFRIELFANSFEVILQ